MALLLLIAAGRAQADASAKEQAGSPKPELLRLLRESRAPYNTFATRFSQRKHLDMLEVDLTSEGMIFFSRPGLVRYEILSPVRSLMAYDGKKVRCYAFSESKWRLLNNPSATAIGQVLRQIGRWIQGDFDADRKMFEISVVPSAQGGCIHLVPRSEAEVDEIIRWLTGYTQQALQKIIDNKTDFETFFAKAPQLNPNVSKITGTICDDRVEDIEDPLMQKIRYLDKLIDELAKGKAMEKILRK